MGDQMHTRTHQRSSLLWGRSVKKDIQGPPSVSWGDHVIEKQIVKDCKSQDGIWYVVTPRGVHCSHPSSQVSHMYYDVFQKMWSSLLFIMEHSYFPMLRWTSCSMNENQPATDRLAWICVSLFPFFIGCVNLHISSRGKHDYEANS